MPSYMAITSHLIAQHDLNFSQCGCRTGWNNDCCSFAQNDFWTSISGRMFCFLVDSFKKSNRSWVSCISSVDEVHILTLILQFPVHLFQNNHERFAVVLGEKSSYSRLQKLAQNTTTHKTMWWLIPVTSGLSPCLTRGPIEGWSLVFTELSDLCCLIYGIYGIVMFLTLTMHVHSRITWFSSRLKTLWVHSFIVMVGVPGLMLR